jgi:hypothetical protein
MEAGNRSLAVFGNQVLEAPGIPRLEDAHFVAAGNQFAGNAAQKMRVSVIPIGDYRLTKQSGAHGMDFSSAASRF